MLEPSGPEAQLNRVLGGLSRRAGTLPGRSSYLGSPLGSSDLTPPFIKAQVGLSGKLLEKLHEFNQNKCETYITRTTESQRVATELLVQDGQDKRSEFVLGHKCFVT